MLNIFKRIAIINIKVRRFIQRVMIAGSSIQID